MYTNENNFRFAGTVDHRAVKTGLGGTIVELV